MCQMTVLSSQWPISKSLWLQKGCMIHEGTREPILFLSPHWTSHLHKCPWFAYEWRLLWASAKGPGVEVVHLWWKTLNVKWSSFLFFSPLFHHFHSTHWPRSALPPAHSLPAPLTHLMLLYLYQTPLSGLTSLHPSVCPSSFSAFSLCPHFLPIYPNTSSFSIFLFLTQSFHLSLIPSIPFLFSNPYSCHLYMAA